MSDSFADLWASSAPTKSTPQHQLQKIGSSIPPRRQQYDAFSILSASQPSTRPVVIAQPNDQQTRQPRPTSCGDAFSDLFPGTPTSQNADSANMTMAERVILVQKAKLAHNNVAATQIEPASSPPSLWDGLDALVQPSTASPRPTVVTQENTAPQGSFCLEFDSVAAAETSTAHPQTDDWGLSGFTSQSSESPSAPPPTKPVSGSRHTTLWDLDEFGPSRPRTSPPQPQGTPSDFDFGDREDGLLESGSSDAQDTHADSGDDDILGDLGKPMSHSHSPSPNMTTSIRHAVRPHRMRSSPPPHITGQLVEMGFSPIDARTALASTVTENGFDVQAAAELLLSQAGQDGSSRPSSRPPEHERRRNRDPARRPPPSRTDTRVESLNPSQPQPQPDTTTEKLLSQASEISRGMFSKANALWKEGKERAVKMYEEKAAAVNAMNATLDGRPRWMRDDERQRQDWTDGDVTVQGQSKDDENEERAMEWRQTQRCPQSSQPQPPPLKEIDLFNADSPTTVYQSPFRHGKHRAQAPSPLSVSAQTPSTQTPAPGPLTSQRPQSPPRTLTTTISLSTLTTSTSHKSAGTDAYKRGDFPVALAAYMRALSALPQGHILRLPILTNLALVHSKMGELKVAIRTCEDAIVLVRQFHSGTNGSGWKEEEMSFARTESGFDVDEKTRIEVGTGKVIVSAQSDSGPTSISNRDLPTTVDLVEGLSKAFRRRAEALEALEKWETAWRTWEALLSAEWASASVKDEAVKGVSRCRRMVESLSSSGRRAPRLVSQSKPETGFGRIAMSQAPSAAVTALRKTHDAQQTEDAARLACKDAVDARLNAWKSGREGNIRALLTSLDDTVLWPELEWRKVGMAEVVSKGQLKGAYVRAIARVHPDKVGSMTVEQKMIANGVFGALNEAWNVFQQ